jgi:formate dehydrogenase iron-sulfur subunit
MKGFLHDVSRCVGCNECVAACAAANGTEDPEHAKFDRSGLSGHRFTALEERADGHFVRRHCLHCLEPSCVSACLVGSMTRTDEGAVVYDPEKCIGCRYCMLACPYTVPKYQWDTTTPLVRKCEMCHDRPGGPACVAACPHEATIFGDRDELLRIAHDRIRSDPDRYVNRVYGATEMGGTAVLYVSDVPLDADWPGGPDSPSVPEITWPFVSKTPVLALGVATALTGVSWVVHRRMKLQGEAAEEAGSDGREAAGETIEGGENGES